MQKNPGPYFTSAGQWNNNTNPFGRWRRERREPWLKYAGARPVAAERRAIPANRQNLQVMTRHLNCWQGPHRNDGPYHRPNINRNFKNFTSVSSFSRFGVNRGYYVKMGGGHSIVMKAHIMVSGSILDGNSHPDFTNFTVIATLSELMSVHVSVFLMQQQ